MQNVVFPKKVFSFKIAAIFLFILLVLLVIFTFKDYGISWDEHFHLTYGKYLIDYYVGLLRGQPDLNATGYWNLYLYGGAYDLSAAVIAKLIRHFVPIGEVEVHHLINGLIGVVGIIGAWATTRLLAGDKAAFWSALFLSIVPAFYGHLFFNPKDIPFAAGYIWSIYLLLRLFKNSQKMDWKGILFFGAMVGITSAIRVGGLILLSYFGLGLVWKYLTTYRLKKPVSLKSLIYQVVLPITISFVISWCFMLAFWPWAQLNPILNPLRALRGIAQDQGPLVVLFRGQFFPTDQVPFDYIFGYFAVILPELLLVLLVIGLLLLIQAVMKQKTIFSSPTFKFLGCCLLVIAVVIPPIVAMVGTPILYDGIRHFLFVIPPLACLAGISFQALINRLWMQRRTLAVALQVMVGLYLIYHLSILVRLHPYEYIYYNALVGGLPGASLRYETDYWGTAGSEAARWLTDYLTANQQGQAGQIKVYYCNDKSSVKYYLPNNITMVKDPTKADYFIGGIREFCNDEITGEEIYTVTRMGVPLSAVKIPN